MSWPHRDTVVYKGKVEGIWEGKRQKAYENRDDGMGVKEEESCGDNRDPLWKWMQPLRMQQQTQGRGIIRLPSVYAAAKRYDWSSQSSSALLTLIIYCQQRGFSNTTLRTSRKSALQFHLKFISIRQVQFICNIAAIPRYVCQSLLVKRHGWLSGRHHQTSFKDTMLAFEATLFHTKSSLIVSSVWM